MTRQFARSEAVHAFREARPQIIERSLLEARRWCPEPARFVEGKRLSDQYWLELLARRPEEFSEARVTGFLASFQLSMKRTWDKPRVALALRELPAQIDANVSGAVCDLAVELRRCLRSRNPADQTSAASKLAFFARPSADVFIWDRLARLSAAFRERIEGDQFERLTFNSLAKHFQSGEYSVFSQSCQRVRSDERPRSDFREAEQSFHEHLTRTKGPMAEGQLVSRGFIERRFLDKLMYCEGEFLEALFEINAPAA